MEKRNFEVFRGMFDELYLQHFKALLRSRLYAIFREGEKLVLKPATHASIGSYASALDTKDFLFLKNLPEDYKKKLMAKYEEFSCDLSDLSYEEYIKSYGPSIEEGKAVYKDRTWGLYVNPLYAYLEDAGFHNDKAALPKFDYISYEKEGHLLYNENDLMYVMVDSAMGVVIGGNDYLVSEHEYWREGEKWSWEEWHINVFTTNIRNTALTQLFEDFCKKNYKKDESGQFYVIPFSVIEKWEVTVHRRNHKLPIHKMYYHFKYDERTDSGTYYPTLYLVGKGGYKQRL